MALIDDIKGKAISAAVMKSYDMLMDDFDGNLPRVKATIDKFAGMGDNINDAQLRLFNMVMGYMADPTNNWRRLVDKVRLEVDPGVSRAFVQDFLVNSVTIGGSRQREVNETEDCNCPWAILMDPTTACNLHCTGCWASNYEDAKHKSLTYDELDSIIRQGKELGTYVYLYTGGEPMVRKGDLTRLCEAHPDCFFSAFTNGTLVDEKFADDMLRVKNFMPAFSIEGFREATDARRGQGTFDKVVHAMDLLRERHLPFGASICYTSQNYDSVTSDEFVDFLAEKGVLFAWIFTYMPVGQGAPVELLATDEQRAGMYHKVRDDWRQTKPIFFADFWNDGEYTGGCIAGGRRYLHINAGGDVEPCAFIHYSDCNVREKSLLECYKSPLFKAYRAHQPFNTNMLRPCPLLDNPGALAEVVHETDAKSTDYTHPEDVDELCSKTTAVAEAWATKSQPLWDASPKGRLSQRLAEEGKDPNGWIG
ncbi:MAG: radical SAM protein [Atopobiaceae bacterium]|jgi:MoaA/NifB/PqqE/SkfB family radical SAM enzyme|nr:radical SAM protein [Atopobiaceae bacterium]MCI2173365.1 radical SAM protein [Atopobiaceae bacterium]MCI2207360.1 radical SAM protein [Atopobiaceae bacterium]